MLKEGFFDQIGQKFHKISHKDLLKFVKKFSENLFRRHIYKLSKDLQKNLLWRAFVTIYVRSFSSKDPQNFFPYGWYWTFSEFSKYFRKRVLLKTSIDVWLISIANKYRCRSFNRYRPLTVPIMAYMAYNRYADRWLSFYRSHSRYMLNER